MQGNCYYCNSNCEIESAQKSFGHKYNCLYCGKYIYESYPYEEIYSDKKHIIAAYLYEINRNSKDIIEINSSDKVIGILENEKVPKNIEQKLDKVLVYLYKNSNEIGKLINIQPDIVFRIGYVKSKSEFVYLLNSLHDEGFIVDNYPAHNLISLTIKGANHVEKILAVNSYIKNVFVAMGYYEELLEAHYNAIKPACEQLGFNAKLISEEEHNEDINYKMIAEIKSSKFVIVDFTYNNHGAYFEAGYAQGRGLEVIRICKKEWFDEVEKSADKKLRLHFDVNHYNFILWENKDDLKEKLIDRIKATIL